MTTLSALSATLGAASASAAAVPPPDRREEADSAVMLRLVNRMTFGFTQEEWSLAKSLGPRRYIAYHLNYTAIDDSEVDQILAGADYDPLRSSPDQLWRLYYGGHFNSYPIIRALIAATTLRAVKSRRQFFERMVEFWSDHFNIYLFADFCDLLKAHDDTNVIRKHALGKFRSLLGASARSPAMLSYLNNNTNVKEHPNENYARELLELHTMGVDGGYTQADVMAVARCFTGWTIYPAGTVGSSLSFVFQQTRHDPSPKTLFAGTPHETVIPAGNQSQGERVLDALCAHPSTARFIAKKLLKKFWGESPTQEMIDGIASVFTATGGDIKAVMNSVLWMNLAYWTPHKYKRPFHVLVSMMRSLSANLPSWEGAAGLIYGAGHYPFFWPAPNGYPDSMAYWSSLQLPRWNIAAYLLDSRFPLTYIDARKLMAGVIGTEGVLDRLEELMLGQPMPREERAALRAFLGPGNATPPWSKIQDVVALAVASPSFQWY